MVLIFMVTPLVGLSVIGQFVAGVIWALLGVISVLVVSVHRAAAAMALTVLGGVIGLGRSAPDC